MDELFNDANVSTSNFHEMPGDALEFLQDVYAGEQELSELELEELARTQDRPVPVRSAAEQRLFELTCEITSLGLRRALLERSGRTSPAASPAVPDAPRAA